MWRIKTFWDSTILSKSAFILQTFILQWSRRQTNNDEGFRNLDEDLKWLKTWCFIQWLSGLHKAFTSTQTHVSLRLHRRWCCRFVAIYRAGPLALYQQTRTLSAEWRESVPEKRNKGESWDRSVLFLRGPQHSPAWKQMIKQIVAMSFVSAVHFWVGSWTMNRTGVFLKP